MKKLIFITIIISIPVIKLYSQTFNKYHKDLNLGVGIGNNLYHKGTFITGIPPVTLSFDYGLNDVYGPGVIGIGGIVGFASFKDETVLGTETSGYKYSALFLGARATYHIEFIKNLDTYAGLMLYYVSLDANSYGTFDVDQDINSKMGMALVLGSKYYFNEKIAIFAELGYSMAWLTTGVTFKL